MKKNVLILCVVSFVSACASNGSFDNPFEKSNFTKESSSVRTGKVVSVRDYTVTESDPNYLAIAAGTAIGGLLGNQVGGGSGKKIATVAGAVGGGYAGHKLTEKPEKIISMQEIKVRDNSGDVYVIQREKTDNVYLQVGSTVNFEISGKKARLVF